MKKKSLFVTIILLLIAIFAFSLTACDKEVITLKSLQNAGSLVPPGDGRARGGRWA